MPLWPAAGGPCISVTGSWSPRSSRCGSASSHLREPGAACAERGYGPRPPGPASLPTTFPASEPTEASLAADRILPMRVGGGQTKMEPWLSTKILEVCWKFHAMEWNLTLQQPSKNSQVHTIMACGQCHSAPKDCEVGGSSQGHTRVGSKL